jgi:two-component system, chemotaxis family, CheB/CheR fusion protein
MGLGEAVFQRTPEIAVAVEAEPAELVSLLAIKALQRGNELALLNTLPAPIYMTDASGRITFYNAAAIAFWGRRPRLDSDRWCGALRLFSPDGVPMAHADCPMAIALRERRPMDGQEAIAERPDGTRVPFLAYPTPLFDAAGTLTGAINTLIDLTDHKHHERATRWLVSIVESSDDAIVSKDLNGVIATWNKGAERLFGYLAAEVVGKPIMIIIPPDRQAEEADIIRRIQRGERIDHFETVRRRKDGSLVEISLTISPVTDSTGTIIGAAKIARDITDRKRRDEQITLLAREADHRTKNLLALAQATVHMTQAETPDELKKAVEGRLAALANAHTLLARSHWDGADLRDLVAEELRPYRREDEPQAVIEGPSLMLGQDAAQAMAVSLHELATNAVKYGALSLPEGRIRVEWRYGALRRLYFRWTESGGPAVVGPPQRRGFGTRVINRMIDSRLNSDVRFHWHTTGLVCEIDLEL